MLPIKIICIHNYKLINIQIFNSVVCKFVWVILYYGCIRNIQISFLAYVLLCLCMCVYVCMCVDLCVYNACDYFVSSVTICVCRVLGALVL